MRHCSRWIGIALVIAGLPSCQCGSSSPATTGDDGLSGSDSADQDVPNGDGSGADVVVADDGAVPGDGDQALGDSGGDAGGSPATMPVHADAGSDQVVGHGRLVRLDASASQGSGLTYTWLCLAVDGSTWLSTSSPAARTVFAAPEAGSLVNQSLACHLTVTDGYTYDSAACRVLVRNRAPTAKLRASWDDTTQRYELRLPPAAEAYLDASGSSDPDGDVLTFSWDGASEALGGDELASPLITLAAPAVDGQELSLRLSVSDGVTDSPPITIAVMADGLAADPCVYVDDDADTSSDPDGSFGKPFGTIGAAMDAALASERYQVCLQAGTYREEIVVHSGVVLLGLDGPLATTLRPIGREGLLVPAGEQATIVGLTIHGDAWSDGTAAALTVRDGSLQVRGSYVYGPQGATTGYGIQALAGSGAATLIVEDCPHLDGGSFNQVSVAIAASSASRAPLGLVVRANSEILGTTSYRLPTTPADRDLMSHALQLSGSGVTGLVADNARIWGGRARISYGIYSSAGMLTVRANGDIEAYPGEIDPSDAIYEAGLGIAIGAGQARIEDNDLIASGYLPMGTGIGIALSGASARIIGNGEIRGTTGSFDDDSTPLPGDAVKGRSAVGIILAQCGDVEVSGNGAILAGDTAEYSAGITDGYVLDGQVVAGWSQGVRIAGNDTIASLTRAELLAGDTTGELFPYPWAAVGVALIGTSGARIEHNPPTLPTGANGLLGGKAAADPLGTTADIIWPGEPIVSGLWLYGTSAVTVDHTVIANGTYSSLGATAPPRHFAALIGRPDSHPAVEDQVALTANVIISGGDYEGGIAEFISVGAFGGRVTAVNNIIATTMGARLTGMHLEGCQATVVNNTFDIDHDPPVGEDDPPQWRRGITIEGGEVSIANNIVELGLFGDEGTDRVVLEERAVTAQSAVTSLRGNLWWIDGDSDGRGIPFAYYRFSSQTTEPPAIQRFDHAQLDDFPSGVCDHNRATDPLLNRPADPDAKWLLRLSAASPAIDWGVPEGAPSDDIDGNARSDGHPDAGADEW